MGMAGGAYKGDKERAQLALQARQIANQNANARQNAALRQQELEQREKSRAESKALAEREMAFRQQQQQWDNDFKQQRQNADIAHLQTQDKIALRAAERADEVLQQKYAQQSQVYGGYQQLAKQARAQQEQRQALGQAAVASVMKLAMYSGGKDAKGQPRKGAVPMYALQALNRDMGFDGENQGFVSGGYTQNGDFYLQYAQKDPQTGQMVTRPQVLSPIDQYRVMNHQQGIFDNNDRGTMAAQLKQAGFRNDEILLASGINQTQLEQMQKLAKAKQVQGDTLKDRLSALTAIKGFIDGDGANVDENVMNGLKAAYQNGMMQIAAQFLPKQQNGGNALTLNEDGTLTLPNGKTLRPGQEYTNAKDGAKYIWKGGGVGNDSFEKIETGKSATQAPNPAKNPAQQPNPNDPANTMTDSEFSARRAHQAQYYGKVQPGYELETDAQFAQQADPTQEAEDKMKNGELETFKPSVTINPSDFQPIPDGDNEGAASAANAPSGGMAAGASGTSGAPAPGGSQGVSEAVFEKMKAKGLLDKDMTFDQFVALQEEEEENGGGEGVGGGE